MKRLFQLGTSQAETPFYLRFLPFFFLAFDLDFGFLELEWLPLFGLVSDFSVLVADSFDLSPSFLLCDLLASGLAEDLAVLSAPFLACDSES